METCYNFKVDNKLFNENFKDNKSSNNSSREASSNKKAGLNENEKVNYSKFSK